MPKEKTNECSKNQTSLVQNWKEPNELSNKSHNTKENRKVVQVVTNEIDFKDLNEVTNKTPELSIGTIKM